MTELMIVVAAAENGVIGADDAMPWRQPTDMARFRRLTMGKPVVMGRHTFASIGKPLPGRTSIVVSRGGWTPPEGVYLTRTLDAALDLAKSLARRDGLDEACVIGGAQIYTQSLPDVDTVHLTRIHAEIDGDATFPDLGDDWSETERTAVDASERDDHAMSFLTYRRADRSA